MAETLYERLAAEKLAGVKIDGGYQFRTNENAALAVIYVVAQWLRDEAAKCHAVADQVGDRRGEGQARLVVHEARALEQLADVIEADRG